MSEPFKRLTDKEFYAVIHAGRTYEDAWQILEAAYSHIDYLERTFDLKLHEAVEHVRKQFAREEKP